jgi:drug/metabolite transporter (DMT)-like permease
VAFSGVLYMSGMLFYLRALQSVEASAVAPFYQAAPLFGYVLGYVVLGEALSPVQMGGGALIIAGTVLVSLQFDQRKAAFNVRLTALMLACALSMAMSSLIFKIFALRDEFWPTTFWMYAGEALFGAVLLAITSFRRPFIELLRSSPGAVLSVNAINEMINLGGSLGTRYALLLAPLSLVQAIGSTTTLFVFAFGIVLSIFCPTLGHEELSRLELVRKGVAAAVVAIGAILVSH